MAMVLPVLAEMMLLALGPVIAVAVAAVVAVAPTLSVPKHVVVSPFGDARCWMLVQHPLTSSAGPLREVVVVVVVVVVVAVVHVTLTVRGNHPSIAAIRSRTARAAARLLMMQRRHPNANSHVLHVVSLVFPP